MMSRSLDVGGVMVVTAGAGAGSLTGAQSLANPGRRGSCLDSMALAWARDWRRIVVLLLLMVTRHGDRLERPCSREALQRM